MGRKSTKINKSVFQIRREELGLSREKASELLETISKERLNRIESGDFEVYPEEVLRMSQVYKSPHLCNHYCSMQCAIGQEYVPEVKVRSLSDIVLEMLSILNNINKQKDKLIDISADGMIDESEKEDFLVIQEALERLSITVEALQLWTENVEM